jgi:hypothetical protein
LGLYKTPSQNNGSVKRKQAVQDELLEQHCQTSGLDGAALLKPTELAGFGPTFIALFRPASDAKYH